MASYPTNKERTNFARLSRVIIDVCADILRDILNGKVSPAVLKSKLQSCSLDWKRLTVDQKNNINNVASFGSYEKFDITLLYTILRSIGTQELRDALQQQIVPKDIQTVVNQCPALKLQRADKCNVSNAASKNSYAECDDKLLLKLLLNLCPIVNPIILHPTMPWGMEPDLADFALGDDIERIRLIRNEVYGHISSTELSDKNFNKEWSKLEDIMVRMDREVQVTGAMYKQELDNIKTVCMDEVSEKRYCQEMKMAAEREKRLEEKVSGVAESVAEIKVDVAELKYEKDSLSLEIEKTRTSQEQMSSNFEIVKKEHEAKNQVVNESIDKMRDETRSTLASMEEEIEKTKQHTRASLASIEVNVSHQVAREIGSRMNENERTMDEKLNVITQNVEDKIKEQLPLPQRHYLEQQTLERIDGHRKDITFVATDVIDKGEKIMYDRGWVIYTGTPGSGKTTIALEIMKRVQDSHADWTLLKLADVKKWNDCEKPAGKSLVFLEDFLGRTNTDADLLDNGKMFWPDIYASITNGTVKVIMTVRKNLLDKNFLKLEQYELFKRNCILIDLTKEENMLSEDEKRDIFVHHCQYNQVNNIKICPRKEYAKENYKSDETPIFLSDITVDKIVRADPVLGFPLSCSLFASNRNNIKHGEQFFSKPCQYLLDDLQSMISSESKYIDKVQYCLMCYMLYESGKFSVRDFDQDLLKIVINSLELPKWPTKREMKEALGNLSHRYILKINESEFEFIHQTVPESIAICFFEDNPNLLLDTCSEDFLKEFIRGPDYKKSEGEIIINVNQKECVKLAKRFVLSTLRYKNDTKQKFYLENMYDTKKFWWMKLPLVGDKQFVDCFLNVAQKREGFIKQHASDIISVACDFGKTYLLDRLFNIFSLENLVEWKFSIDRVVRYGHTETVIWLIHHRVLKLDYLSLKTILEIANADTVTAVIEQPSVSLEDIRPLLNFVFTNGNSKTVQMMLHKWTNLPEDILLELLNGRSFNDDYMSVKVILHHRKEFITQKTLSSAFTLAIVGNAFKTIEYLLGIWNANSKPIHILFQENVEHITNLHIAAFFGRYEMCLKLIELGINVSAKTVNGDSVLHMVILGYACSSMGSNISGLKVLSDIFYGVKVLQSEIMQDRKAVLAEICNQIQAQMDVCSTFKVGNSDVSRYQQLFSDFIKQPNVDLSDFNISLDKCNNKIVHYCVMYDDVSMIKFIHGINNQLILVKNNEDITAILLAAYLGMWNIFINLIQFGSSLTDRSSSGLSVFQMATIGYTHRGCELNFSDNCKFICSKCPMLSSFFKRFPFGQTHGEISQYEQILSYLINHQDFIDTDLDMSVDGDGHTLAHYCVIYNSPDIIELLCNKCPSRLFGRNTIADACKALQDNENILMPLQFSVLMGRSELFKSLISTDKDEGVNTCGLGNLQIQGRPFTGQIFHQTTNSLPQFLRFLPSSALFGEMIEFGTSDDYDYISSTIHQ